ncbi:hypothetical protein OIDMADRAFT_46970 [Oidiodendron maius Zn]|uniref:Amidase domain-containing protein n=1 Tax=Oidiodendron maius (strain Zn) TaxID=913774 RepID=A0A0C3HXW8_OIDMZ|nr:hypothetical protein OIDMADRAFT_46970 [Oidiodendron maius Zn]
MFASALQRAMELDAYFAEYKEPVGPLHGLPISLKDSIHVEVMDTSLGYESQIVTDLRSLGAVIYVKTSLPQGSLSAETSNSIIGYTPNPLNRQLTVGGSSGGEGGYWLCEEALSDSELISAARLISRQVGMAATGSVHQRDDCHMRDDVFHNIQEARYTSHYHDPGSQ